MTNEMNDIDATEYRIIRNTLRTLIHAVQVMGEPALQALAADAKMNLDYTSEAEPVTSWTDAEMLAYAGHPDAEVEF